MEVAYLLSQYPAVNHVFMHREVRGLRALGFTIEVASIRPPDRPMEGLTATEREEAGSTYYVKRTSAARLVSGHVKTLWGRPGRYIRGWIDALRMEGWHGLLYFAEAVAVGQWMRDKRLSHVHTHYASTVGLMVARLFPVTLSMTIHGRAEFEDVAGFHMREKIEACRFACAISEYGRSQMMAASGFEQWSKLEVAALGVDLGEFRPRTFRPAPSPFEIICVGQLAAIKGQHVLLAAMERLVKDGREIRLRLAGDGPERASLEQQTQDRGLRDHVRFEGSVNQDTLREFYRQSDALVLASFAEGLPVVLMEAMAMEIPCVAPWITGIPEIITHEFDGLMVPPGNAEALAAAITRLMDDTEFRQALGPRARCKVLEKFNLQKNTERLAGIFRSRRA